MLVLLFVVLCLFVFCCFFFFFFVFFVVVVFFCFFFFFFLGGGGFLCVWTRQFVLSFARYYFVLVFYQSFEHCDYLAWGRERANLSAFRTFVRFALVWFCLFPLPLCVWEGLRLEIVALPGLFSYPFWYFHCCSSSFLEHRWLRMWRCFVIDCFSHLLLFVSNLVDVKLCFVIVAFPGYLYLYFSTWSTSSFL